MMIKILIVVTNVAMYQSGNLPTGLWLSELTHMYHSAKEQGYEVTIASPQGGSIPLDPESLKPMMIDKLSKKYQADKDFMKLLQHTKNLNCCKSNEMY